MQSVEQKLNQVLHYRHKLAKVWGRLKVPDLEYDGQIAELENYWPDATKRATSDSFY